MSRNYWKVITHEVIPDMGIALTETQRDELLDAITGHAEMEGEATGRYILDQNLRSSKAKEEQGLRDELKFEREKITCRSCDGTGSITTYGGTFQSTSSCHECNGQGRVHPSKASRLTLK